MKRQDDQPRDAELRRPDDAVMDLELDEQAAADVAGGVLIGLDQNDAVVQKTYTDGLSLGRKV